MMYLYLKVCKIRHSPGFCSLIFELIFSWCACVYTPKRSSIFHLAFDYTHLDSNFSSIIWCYTLQYQSLIIHFFFLDGFILHMFTNYINSLWIGFMHLFQNPFNFSTFLFGFEQRTRRKRKKPKLMKILLSKNGLSPIW